MFCSIWTIIYIRLDMLEDLCFPPIDLRKMLEITALLKARRWVCKRMHHSGKYQAMPRSKHIYPGQNKHSQSSESTDPKEATGVDLMAVKVLCGIGLREI